MEKQIRVSQLLQKRMNETIPVKAAGGVVFRVSDRSAEVLLILRNGYWDIPKGKHEPGESIQQCAVREVAEETGASLPILLSSLGTSYHTYEMGENSYEKTTWWYSMVFPREQDLNPQKEEGVERLEWIDLEVALQKVQYDNLRTILKRFRDWLGTQGK